MILRALIRAGDEDAFGELFDEHADAVHRHAVWMDGDPASADDVVSLTFLEAWRVRGTLRPDGESLRPWLLGIATNVLRNRRRAARRHRAAMSRLPAAGAVPDIADEVVARMHDADQVAAATAALRGLRRGDREVFLLCVGQRLDYAAAAEALGVPVGTVRSRLSRARTRLRILAEAELTQPRPPGHHPGRGDPHTGARPAPDVADPAGSGAWTPPPDRPAGTADPARPPVRTPLPADRLAVTTGPATGADGHRAHLTRTPEAREDHR